MVTTLLPHLVRVAELPLLMKVRRGPTLHSLEMLNLLTVIKGVSMCSGSFCRQKALGCSDGPGSGEMSGRGILQDSSEASREFV